MFLLLMMGTLRIWSVRRRAQMLRRRDEAAVWAYTLDRSNSKRETTQRGDLLLDSQQLMRSSGLVVV